MPIMAQICQFCLRSGILCSECQKKVKAGKVTKLDLEVARLLLSMEKKYPPLQELKFYKAVDTDKMLALVVGRGDVARILSYGGKIIKELGNKMGRSIRVLEYGSSSRKFLEDLFAPLNIVTINKIWLPDGTTETRVILKKKGRHSSNFKMNALRDIAKKVRGITLRIEFAN